MDQWAARGKGVADGVCVKDGLASAAGGEGGYDMTVMEKN